MQKTHLLVDHLAVRQIATSGCRRRRHCFLGWSSEFLEPGPEVGHRRVDPGTAAHGTYCCGRGWLFVTLGVINRRNVLNCYCISNILNSVMLLTGWFWRQLSILKHMRVVGTIQKFVGVGEWESSGNCASGGVWTGGETT